MSSAEARHTVRGALTAAVLAMAAAGCWDPTGTAPAGFRYIDVSTGAEHTCGVSPDGSVHCWGAGERGQLGTGAVRSSAAPVRVALGTAALSVSAGGAHTCALTVGGDIWCWGANDHGQLGTSSGSESDTPLLVAGPGAFAAVSSGGMHTCALDLEGNAYCWGADDHGQLGTAANPGEDGPDEGDPDPDAPQVSVAGRRAAASERLQPHAGPATEPTPVAGGHAFLQIAAGAFHTCGVSMDGEAFCWGRNDHGQLGTGDLVPEARPATVASDVRFSRLSSGHLHTCGIAADLRGYCWGSNVHGELGNGGIMPPLTSGGMTPRELITFPPGALSSLSAGVHATCAVWGASTLCWGRGIRGQLGLGYHVDHYWPQILVFPDRDHTRLTMVSAGGDTHVCGLATGGGVYCWGEGPKGQLGVGAAVALVPARVKGNAR